MTQFPHVDSTEKIINPNNNYTMLSKIKNIWIESEHSIPANYSEDEREEAEENLNSDIKVTFLDGTEYVATFFTYKNIETIRLKNRITGESLSGFYFWASNMLIIDDLSRFRVEQIINQLILEDEFESVFKKIK